MKKTYKLKRDGTEFFVDKKVISFNKIFYVMKNTKENQFIVVRSDRAKELLSEKK